MNPEWQTILAALLSTLALGYYFIPPIYTSDRRFRPWDVRPDVCSVSQERQAT